MGKEVNGTSNRIGQSRVLRDDESRKEVFVFVSCCISFALPFHPIVLLACSHLDKYVLHCRTIVFKL